MAEEKCPKCEKPLGEITETQSGKRLQRCSGGSWDPNERVTLGCDYIKWLEAEVKQLDELCPKCQKPLVMAQTRAGKKMKKCSTNVWNPDTRTAEGCDYIEWINGTTKPLKEECPDCNEPLVLYTTATGKKMKKCSASGWDRENRVPIGCTYVEWL